MRGLSKRRKVCRYEEGKAGLVESRNDTLRLKRGWSTASSEIESCHGTIVQPRLKIGGAWWRPDNVDDILALRMLKANGWWEDYGTDQRQQWRHRANIFTKTRSSMAA